MLVLGLVTAGLQLVQVSCNSEWKQNPVSICKQVLWIIYSDCLLRFTRNSPGDLTNRALSINGIRQILSNTVMTAVLSGAFSFVNLVLLFYYESSLAWIGVGLALLAMAFMNHRLVKIGTIANFRCSR